MNIIHETQKQLANDVLSKQNDKFKECLIIYGVDPSNEDEVKKSCEVKIYQGDPLKELFINGKLAALFTDPIVKPFDMESPNTITAEFKFQIIPPITH